MIPRYIALRVSRLHCIAGFKFQVRFSRFCSLYAKKSGNARNMSCIADLGRGTDKTGERRISNRKEIYISPESSAAWEHTYGLSPQVSRKVHFMGSWDNFSWCLAFWWREDELYHYVTRLRFFFFRTGRWLVRKQFDSWYVQDKWVYCVTLNIYWLLIVITARRSLYFVCDIDTLREVTICMEDACFINLW